MSIKARTRAEFNAITTVLKPYSQAIESAVGKQSDVPAYCRACEQIRMMRVTGGEPPGSWRNLLEGMICECSLNGRTRLILTILDEVLMTRKFDRSLVLERLTPLYSALAKRIPRLTGCEYLGSAVPAGASVDKHGISVQSESLMALSFESASLDLIMHFDVLEHVPDWRLALRECWRVLSVGGVVLFTAPFYDGLEKNVVRAEIHNGRLWNHLPATYHGNPLTSEGSLVFIHPSWEVFDFILSLGFQSVEIAVCYDPLQGIFSNGCPYSDGHMWPVVFILTK